MPDYDDECGFDGIEHDDVPDEPFEVDDATPRTEPAGPRIAVSVKPAVSDHNGQELPEPDERQGDEPDEEYVYVYVDEQGNEVDPTTLEEVAAGQNIGASAPRMDRRGKTILAGVGVAVAAVVTVVAVGLGQLGGQNTVDDARAAGQSKYVQASSAVASKSSEVRGEASGAAIDTCRTGKLSGPGGLGDAISDGSEAPKLKLDVIAATPLPGAFIAARTNADGKAGTPSLLQLTKTSWGAYTMVPLTKAEKKAEIDKPGFWKADVQVTDTSIRVTGDRVWAGGDTGGVGSCEPGEPGVYAASGRVPADAAGLVDGTASVDAIQGVAGQSDRAVALMGNSVALVRLVENLEEGGDASSSDTTSK